MTAEFNSTEKRVELLADGTGWQRMKTVELDPVPEGANQMLVVFQCWHTALDDDWSDTTTYSPSSYVGLSFTGNHIDTTDATDSEYDNLFGFAACDVSAPFTSVFIDESSRFSSLGISSSVGAYALSAYDVIDNDISSGTNTDSAFMIQNGEVGNDGPYYYCWRIYTDLVDDSIHYQVWVGRSNIDLETFDFSTVNPDNPKDQLPERSFYSRSGTIHGDITGTNWRPSTGVMAFPSHFLAKWGGDNVGMGIYIKNLTVSYHKLTS